MKLFYTPIVDLIHKVQAVAVYAGVYETIERIPTNPFKRDPAHIAANPLSKVPTLVLDDGSPLYGGPEIYEYLDLMHGKPKLFPGGAERWPVLRRLMLADGLWDVAVQREGETGRPENLYHEAEIEKHTQTMNRCLDRMDQEVASYRGFTIDQISAASGLMYLDRLHTLGRPRCETNWRESRPNLTAWYHGIIQRPELKPHDNDFRAAFNQGDTRSRWGIKNALSAPG